MVYNVRYRLKKAGREKAVVNDQPVPQFDDTVAVTEHRDDFPDDLQSDDRVAVIEQRDDLPNQPVPQSVDPSTLDDQIYYEDLGLVDFLGGVQVSIVHNATQEQLLQLGELFDIQCTSLLSDAAGSEELNDVVTYTPATNLTCDVSSQLDAVASPETQILQHEGQIDALSSTVIEQSCDQVTPNRRRKRRRNVDGWKSIKRQKLTQSGQEYVNVRGKVVPAKRVKEHKSDCRLSCNEKLSDDARKHLHDDFWKLTDLQKGHYFVRTTEKVPKARIRKRQTYRTNKKIHKKFTFRYYFIYCCEKIQVCKSFYLATLDISQNRIISYHANKDKVTGTPPASKRGKHTKHNMSDADIKAVREHISSFPRVESHYRRAQSQKEYLEDGLNLSLIHI